MSYWNSGPDRTEDLRHSDPMTPEQEEREALERYRYLELLQGHHILTSESSRLSRELDEHGKGLKPITILRNPEAAELFHRHSLAYQERQQKVRKAKYRHAKPKPQAEEVQASYRGLRSPDLIQMVEELKTQLAELKVQQEKLKAERDAAYHLRDEVLLHNTRQLAALRAHASPMEEKPK